MEGRRAERLALVKAALPHLLNYTKYGDFPAALRGAALANDFQYILLTESYYPVLRIETRHRTTVEEAVRLARKTALTDDALYTRIDVNGIVTYWGKITLHGERLLHFIVDNEESYTAEEVTDLGEMIALSMGLWRYTPQHDAQAALLHAVRRGDTLTARNAAGEAEVAEDALLAVFGLAGEGVTKTAEWLTAAREKSALRILVEEDEGALFGVVACTETAEMGRALAEWRSVCEESHLTEDVRLYHVTESGLWDGASRGFRLLGETMAHAEVIFPDRRVFSRYDLALVHSGLEIWRRGGDDLQMYRELTDVFRDIGEKKREDLLSTLSVFLLDAAGSSAETAARMGVHMNTVQYRLRRAGELLGTEVSQGESLPALTIALALRRLEKGAL